MPFPQSRPELAATGAGSLADVSQLAEVTSRFGIAPSEIQDYLQPGEQLTGFGTGGSESLVMFVTTPLGRIVRKVCAEELCSVDWDVKGEGVMASPSTKGGLQVAYLQSLPERAQPYFPQIYNAHHRVTNSPDGNTWRRFVYDQSMLEGSEVSGFIADAQPTPAVVTRLHHEIMRLLDEKIHPERQVLHTGDSIGPSHLNKIEARLELSRSAAPRTFGPLIDAERINIDGKEYPNIGELIKFFRQPQIREMLEPKVHSLVMGDTNTENVMITNPDALLDAMAQGGKPEFTYKDIGLKFFDPRAIGHNSVGADTRDDRMYDNKPVHNTLGNYDLIHGEHFSIAVNSESPTPQVRITPDALHPYKASYEGMADSNYFEQVMQAWGVNDPERVREDPNWLLRFTFMMGSHFAAMPPFHFSKGPDGVVAEDPEQQKRAIAIYCEGIKWLNYAKEMIVGQRQELFGVKLGALAASGRPSARTYNPLDPRNIRR
jgi:hypothetical protein